MAIPRWILRNLGETRGDLLVLLQHEPHTVDELARAVGRTRNAVRSHLTALERDGFVERSELRRERRGQPAQVYRIAERNEVLLSRAYPRAALGMLDAMEEHLAAAQIGAVMRSAGRRLAPRPGNGVGSLRARAEAARAALDELGGVADLEVAHGTLEILSRSCPLYDLTKVHPAACLALEAFVAEIIGAPVKHRCERGLRHQCRFMIHGDETAPDASGYPGE